MNGRTLHFYLAGINNQNFLMRDRETGTWWQQITGKAISGPMKGAALELVLSDELTFGEWKAELARDGSDGKVLAQVPKYVKEYDPNWEPEVAKYPVPISFPGTELKSRDVIVGLEIGGPGRAYPWETLVKQSPVMDHVNGMPILVAVGPDGKSFRVFISRIDGKDAEFFLKAEPDSTAGAPSPEATTSAAVKVDAGAISVAPSAASTTGTPTLTAKASSAPATSASTPAPAPTPAAPKSFVLIDTITASEWNFQGCAVSGPSQGKCLDRIPALKDYWFDWRNYHPETTIYKR